MAGDKADDTLDLGCFDPDTAVHTAFAEAVEPQHSIGIDHDLLGERIGQRGGDLRAHGCPKHRPAARAGMRWSERGCEIAAPSPASEPRVRRTVATWRTARSEQQLSE